jgi:hypothetical protein
MVAEVPYAWFIEGHKQKENFVVFLFKHDLRVNKAFSSICLHQTDLFCKLLLGDGNA